MELLEELSAVPADKPTKREICQRCRRPLSVCVCSCFPPEPIPIQTRIIILQHPHEENRCLATVPLLQECLPKDRCHVLKGKRFASTKNKLLQDAMMAPDSVVLFPGRNAVDVRSLPPIPIGHYGNPSALIVLDGTWAQAKGMFAHNAQLHRLVQVQLSAEAVSEYVIRTQPTQFSLSTLECVAHALAWFEQKPDIIEVLLCPLRALCQHQLDHGAVVHMSKEHPDYISRSEMKTRQEWGQAYLNHQREETSLQRINGLSPKLQKEKRDSETPIK